MDSTLVIIDMQEGFEAAHLLSVQQTVSREIISHMERKLPIIWVEYHGFGPTVGGILSLLTQRGLGVVERPNVFRVRKFGDDGSVEVADTIVGFGLSWRNIRVCGVNGEACVKQTREGLAFRFPSATIHEVETNTAHVS